MPHLLRFTVFCIVAASSTTVAQGTYPSANVRIIVPFTPGTGIDILARTLGQKMGDDFKQAVIVDNRPGASGNIGTEAVAKAAPDGYTLLMTANTIVLNRSLFKSIPYDPIKYGSPGNGTPHHLAMELFKSKTGIDIVHVPYKGTSGAVTDLLSGQINVMFLPVHVALPYVESGKLDMLAAGGTARASATPAIPSLAEAAGIREVDTDIWYGLYSPVGTPADVVRKFGTEVNALLKSRDVADTLAKQGLQPTGGTSDDLAQLTRTDLERWAAVVRDAKIQPD